MVASFIIKAVYVCSTLAWAAAILVGVVWARTLFPKDAKAAPPFTARVFRFGMAALALDGGALALASLTGTALFTATVHGWPMSAVGIV